MSFYWYNQRIVNAYLKAKFRDPDINDHTMGNDSYQKLHRLNLCFSNNPWGVQHDITDHVDHHFNIRTKTPYHYRQESRSFGDLCLHTAQQIAAMTDRDIAVFWSGGIDSTALLTAMLETVEHSRLVVVCNQGSIDEFPSFYDHKINGKVRTIAPALLHKNYQDFFSVTGDGGDTVWGVIDSSFWSKYSDRVRQPWQDCIDRTIMSDLDFVEQFNSWSGVDIRSWLDLRTWFYLCCKWQDKCMRPYFLRKNITDQDIVSFYDTDPSFQVWTMNNLDKIIGAHWQDYKMPAKEFIYQYHQDIGYLRNKSKEESQLLKPDLITKDHYYLRVAVSEDFKDYEFPSWPFVDYAEIEDFNDVFNLIPKVHCQTS